MKILIPEQFKSVIDKDDKLMGALLINNSNFSEWLSNNSLDFFPEYTDHGIAHVNCVLTTAAEIISPASYEILTPSDIYVLSTSILLHDCAMHINRDGLWSLLTDEIYNKIMWGFDDDIEWHTKWDEFKQKVKRFTDSDWDGLFGEFRHVKLPDLHEKSLDDNQKILIGDFVRTHHATIAQLIANSGIPTQNGPLDILSKEFSYLNQLSGFIARSHNYSLRHATDLLGDSKKREHRDTHPTYLMGVLRIADYIQFKANRTPKILFKTKSFCSPISIKEWKKHLAIISTNNSHPDDELLFVEAFPEDAITLNSIKYLLLGLQKEIDDFWSVSGEVYSRYPSLKRLGVIYRRIRSNIDNADEYVRHNYKKYHHDTLKIISENQKLFPLLIKPLYGDLPQVGIRELLQNAIDACHERYSIEMGSNVSKLEIPYSISITINFDTLTLTISDQGIGMNVKIIKDYFLKIGASYRTSEAWKAHFLQGEHSFIPRTGKFGIGMLAGFLVGDEIRVTTRHVAEDSRAIDFKYKLDSTDIELLFTTKTSIGTSIEIKSDRERLECIAKSFNLNFDISYYGDGGVNEDINTLSSNWFFLDTPKINIECIIDGDSSSIEKHRPYSKKMILDEWNSIEESILEGFYWRFKTTKPAIYCNGIYVHKAKTPNYFINTEIYQVRLPKIEIMLLDNDGLVPLGLTRKDFVDDGFYEDNKLRTAVINTYSLEIKKTLLNYKFNPDFIKSSLENKLNVGYSQLYPVIFSKDMPYPVISKKVEGMNIFVDFTLTSQERGILFNPASFRKLSKYNLSYMVYLDCIKDADTVTMAINNLLSMKSSVPHTSYGHTVVNWRDYSYIKDIDIKSSTLIFIKKFDLHKYHKPSGDSEEYSIGSNINARSINHDWVLLTNGDFDESMLNAGIEIISTNPNSFLFAIFTPIHIGSEGELVEPWEGM